MAKTFNLCKIKSRNKNKKQVFYELLRINTHSIKWPLISQLLQLVTGAHCKFCFVFCYLCYFPSDIFLIKKNSQESEVKFFFYCERHSDRGIENVIDCILSSFIYDISKWYVILIRFNSQKISYTKKIVSILFPYFVVMCVECPFKKTDNHTKNAVNACDKTSCTPTPTHYDELGCTPILDEDDCCPIRQVKRKKTTIS